MLSSMLMGIPTCGYRLCLNILTLFCTRITFFQDILFFRSLWFLYINSLVKTSCFDFHFLTRIFFRFGLAFGSPIFAYSSTSRPIIELPDYSRKFCQLYLICRNVDVSARWKLYNCHEKLFKHICLKHTRMNF